MPPPAQSPIVLTGRDSFPKDKKRTYRGGGSGNRLIPSATQNWDRKRVPLLDYDIHRNVTSYGRRTMMSLGRRLYCERDPVRGTVEDICRSAARSLVLEYRGEDIPFKTAVENWAYAHDRYCDIAANPAHNAALEWRKMIVRECLVSGDIATVFVRDAQGLPRLQVIPGHRIGSDCAKEHVDGGPFDGAQIIEGVIIDDYCAPLAYRVLKGDPTDYDDFEDVPADRMSLHFLQLFPGQLRGFSPIGFSAWPWQDRGEADKWELLAQKKAAAWVFQVWNEDGEPGPGDKNILAPSATDSTDGTPSGGYFDVVDGGVDVYHKSTDPGAKIAAVEFNRPSSNQAAFASRISGEALYAAGWSMHYSLDPTKVGGAPLRVVVDKLNLTLEDLQQGLLVPAQRRFDAFRVPVAMEMKAIPFTADWMNLEYHPPARLTADRKYDSSVDIEEVKAGIRSRANACGKRDESDQDVLASNVQSVRRIFTEAKKLAAEFGIPFESALNRLELLGQANLTVNAEPSAPDQSNQSD